MPLFLIPNAANLTGDTLAAGVTASSLTSVGTLTALTVSGQASFAAGSAAAPSVKVGGEQNGLYSSAANTLDVTLNGVRSFQFLYAASAVNRIQASPSATGLPVALLAAGNDTNISFGIYGKGSGTIFNVVRGSTALLIDNPASAVNYWSISGAATGGLNTLTTQGSDTNIGAYLATKGSGAWRFATGGGDQFRIMHAASAVNYFSAYGAASGSGPILYADGSDAGCNANYSLKGGGSHVFYTGSTSAVQFVIAHVASAVNYGQLQGASTGFAPIWSSQGSDTNINWIATSKGSGGVLLYTNLGTALQLAVTHTASAVNYIQATGAATGGAPSLAVGGTDTNIGLSVNTKGTGAMKVLLNSVEAARFSSASTLGAYWDFKYVSGPNEMKLLTGGFAANLGFSSSGGGAIRFYTNDILENQVIINRTASAVNQLALTGSATGGAVTASAEGTDANIDFALTPKGTGVLRFGTHSAIAAETVTGYITIKDSAGNTRKLAVVS